MPQLASGDILLYQIRYTQLSQQFINGVYLRYLDTFGVTDDYATFANAIMNDLEGAGSLLPLIQSRTSVNITITDHRIQKVKTSRLAPIIHTIGTTGSVSGKAAPLNTAVVLTKRTALATRFGIGSWHQPGLPDSSISTAGEWVHSDVDDFGTKLGATFVGMKTPTGQNGSYQGVLFNPAVPGRVTDITSFVSQYTIRTMHRRTVGVGK